MREGVNKVALRLFEHNEKAYHAAVRMMDQYGKAAIVHPTGTGKSYIAFKLIEDNPEKVVIWLSPSEYIFKTQLESLKRNNPDFPLANVHFYTYAKLMCCTQAQLDEIAAQKPAYIILDEFHRAGAECWGESTVALLKLCPNTKLLGSIATNIRYLDNNRDMAEELFDGHIASDMNLGEAVVRGILPAPKYVTTVYQYQKALAKYQARVDNLRAPGIQDVNQNIWTRCAALWNKRMVWIGSLHIISRIRLASTLCSALTRSTWTRWCPTCRSGSQGSTRMWWCTKPTPMTRTPTRLLRTSKRTQATG